AAEVARRGAEHDADRRRDRDDDDADQERLARAPQELRQRVVARAVAAEPVRRRRRGERVVEIDRARADVVGRDPRPDGPHDPAAHDRPALHPAAPRAGGQPRHARRILGSAIPYARSTTMLTVTYTTAITRTHPCTTG